MRRLRLFLLALVALALAALSLSSAISAQTPAGLVSWWPGDRNADDIVDSNPGTLHGGATFAPGKVGQAFSLDGVDDFVQVAHNANLDPGTGSFTIAAWVNKTPSSGQGVIVSKDECGQQCISFVSSSYYIMLVTKGGRFQVRLRDSDPREEIQILTAPTIIADGNFHHVVMQRDMAASELRVYIDGALDRSAALSPGATGAIMDNDGEPDPLIIGATVCCGRTTKQGFFSGLIDEVQFYNRALAQSEIQALCSEANPDQADLDGDGIVDVCDPENTVDIDIKPGSDPNSTNLGSRGVIPVAILTTGTFDAVTVDPATVDLEGAPPPRSAMEDVDEDGDLDLIMHFRTQDMTIADDATEACLTGETFDGQPIRGCDVIRIVPPELDSDGDGFGDAVEASMRTDQFAACPADSSHDAWPPDFNNNTTVDIIDALFFGRVIMSNLADPNYDERYDLNANGTIDIIDVLMLGPVIMQSCVTP